MVSAKNNKSVSDWSIQVCTRAVERVTCLACDDVVVHTLLSIRRENNYDGFDDKTKGWSLYTEPRSFVVACEFSVIERKLPFVL